MWPERFDLDFNDLHHSLFDLHLACKPCKDRTETERVAIAAPRGYAKSTIESFAKLVHSIVYGKEDCIILASAVAGQAERMSGELRGQFTNKNAPLYKLYGPFTVTGGIEGWEVSVRGKPSIAFKPCSVGSEIRGFRHPSRGVRPTLVIIDDGEKKDRVRSPDQRRVWWDWLTKDVLKLGRRQGGTAYRVVGTVLHPESGLAKLLKDAGWVSQRWQAIIAWPVRTDLWDACRLIWADLSLGAHRLAMAKAFYRSHKDEMDRGAVTLDPKTKSLFELYEQIWSEGLASFMQEMQNDPRDPDTQIFFSENFAKFTVDGDEIVVPASKYGAARRVKIASLRKYARWDPSAGSAHGDFAAIAVLGRDELGYTYVLDVWMKRAKPAAQLAAMWLLAERWGCVRATVESNGFQGLVQENYPREREERKAQGRFWRLSLVLESTHENKELRIATLEPDTANGWMLFNTSIPAEVLAQFDVFPTGDNDDGPDAIHDAWVALGGRPSEMAR